MLPGVIGCRHLEKSAKGFAIFGGIAVSLTMLMTSALLFIAMREIWGWALWAAGSVAACFLVIDSAFFPGTYSDYEVFRTS